MGAQHGGLSLVALSKNRCQHAQDQRRKGVVELCFGLGPVIGSILELSSPEGEICSLRFAVRFVQQTRITFRVSAIACQVVCGTSFRNRRYARHFVSLATTVSGFDEVLSENCDGILTSNKALRTRKGCEFGRTTPD